MCNSSIEKAPASYRAVSGPSGPKPQKSQKRVEKESPGPSGPRGAKSPKRAQKESSSFGLFGPPGPEGLGDSFLTLSGFRARRARNGSVAGGGFFNSSIEQFAVIALAKTPPKCILHVCRKLTKGSHST